MALPPYFHRSAIAASQALGGFDESAIKDRLEGQVVGLHLAESALTSESRVALDLTVRLVSRLYPSIVLDVPNELSAEYEAMALRINPNIEFSKAEPSVAIVLGEGTDRPVESTVYLGSRGWDARIDTANPQAFGDSDNPFGAGAAACFAAANLFRKLFTEDPLLDSGLTFSTFSMSPSETATDFRNARVEPVASDALLVGVGAIGQAVVWALSRARGSGVLHLVDHETLDISNLQRYVLAEMDDVGSQKVEIANLQLANGLTGQPHLAQFSTFVEEYGYQWGCALVAVDSAQARREVQASLPRWIANAWTQPGDLGVSVHPQFGAGACLACLYLPQESVDSEDRLIAKALGLGEEHELQIRQLLHTGEAPPEAFLDQVSERLSVPPDVLEPFNSKPLRDLYVEGVCGGLVLPLGRVGAPGLNVHVPVAHQSAMAGVLLAARYASGDRSGRESLVSRLDVTRPVSQFPTQPAAKDPSGRCICNDRDYLDRYTHKYRATTAPT